MRRIVSQLFWETSCVLKLQWDPSKDPTIDCGYNLDPSKTSQLETAQLLKECEEESQAPTLLYISLETFTVRMGIMKTGKLGAGPGSKKLARQVAETGAIMENILMDTIKRLYARAVTLTIAAIDKTESQERKGFLLDLIDSIHEKTTRLLLVREHVRKKIKKLNIRHSTKHSTIGYTQKETLLLYNRTQRLQIYSAK